MSKHVAAVKPFDQFIAPWETEGGTDAEIDKPKLKRYIYNLVTDKAKAQDSTDEAAAAKVAAETERDDAKADAEKASPEEANKKIARLEKANADLKTERDGLVAAKERSDLRGEVLEGLDPKYAKYVQGETREELEKALEQVKADFGLGEEGDEDLDDDEPVIRTAPRTLTNPVDPKSGAPSDKDYDFDKIAGEIVNKGFFG